jgi:copper transport protein
MVRRVVVAVLACLVVVLAQRPAHAHNSFVSSDPADGAVLDTAPTELSMVFALSVPLESASAQLIDETDVRTELTDFRHGDGGDAELVVGLPVDITGEVTVRWRLVGPDGHPLTGRITFTVAAPVAASASTTPASLEGSASSVPDVARAPSSTSDADAPWSTPEPARWLLRYSSYVAMLALGGVAVSAAHVWPGAWAQSVVRRIAWFAVGTIAVAAVLQLWIVASDFGSLGDAMRTDVARALAVRVVAVALLAAVLLVRHPIIERRRWSITAALLLVLLATWAFAGHARSLRIPLLGVPLDVAHHGAAAAWLGGLALVGIFAVRQTEPGERITVVQRFSKVAMVAVAVIVVTGAAQSLRLVGSPTELLATSHGRYLAVKLVVLAAMLEVADVNRRRVARRFQTVDTATPGVVRSLRRAMTTELVAGLAVVALTAAMVTSPPGATRSESGGVQTASD